MSHFVMKDIQSTLFDSIKDVWIYKIYKRRIAPVKVCEGRVDVRSAAILDKFASKFCKLKGFYGNTVYRLELKRKSRA